MFFFEKVNNIVNSLSQWTINKKEIREKQSSFPSEEINMDEISIKSSQIWPQCKKFLRKIINKSGTLSHHFFFSISASDTFYVFTLRIKSQKIASSFECCTLSINGIDKDRQLRWLNHSLLHHIPRQICWMLLKKEKGLIKNEIDKTKRDSEKRFSLMSLGWRERNSNFYF